MPMLRVIFLDLVVFVFVFPLRNQGDLNLVFMSLFYDQDS